MQNSIKCTWLICLLLLLCACGAAPMHFSSFALDTVCTITVYDSEMAPLAQQALSSIDDAECELSRHRPKNAIAQLYQDGGLASSNAIYHLFLLAQQVHDTCDGAFDITMGNLSDLWAFNQQPPVVPTPEQVSAALEHCGMEYLQINRENIICEKGVQVDLGGIAKGYIAAQAARLLKGAGVKSAIVNLGGNVVLIGTKPDGSDFGVGVQKPFDANGTSIAKINANNTSVVTAGVYQRCFLHNGIRYHHVLDPKTGYPARSDLLSATVVCQDAAYADALSTAFLVVGKERALELTAQLGVDALFVDTDMNVTYTAGLEGRVTLY